MLRLPPFRLLHPSSVSDAVTSYAEAQGEVSYMAGGTDLLPNMKRRQQTPRTVISLLRIPELHGISVRDDGGVDIGACTSLTALAEHPYLRLHYPAVSDAAALVSTPLLRNMGTIGGNLLLDTRCNYYNQGYEWRKAISFCMKRDGDTCWVAPSSPRCWAVQQSDSVPVAVALGASMTLTGQGGARTIPAAALYNNDGMRYHTLGRGELLTTLHLPPPGSWRAAYVKLRRRGSFDFPVLGVAAWIALAEDSSVTAARVVLGAVASYPMEVQEAADALLGKPLNAESVTAAAEAAYRPAKPMDNTDLTLSWRKEMVRVHTRRALEILAKTP